MKTFKLLPFISTLIKLTIMSSIIISRFARYFLLTLILGYTSCTDKNKVINRKPVVNAGPKQIIGLPTNNTMLDGSASIDSDGKIIEWHWSKISGPSSFTLAHADSPITLVSNLVKGSYVFELSAKDDGGLTATNRVIIDVGHPPIANAGADAIFIASCTSVLEKVLVDGSGSSDPDNDISSYFWRQISGPKQVILTPGLSQTQVWDLDIGQTAIELSVSDAIGLISKDTIWIDVSSSTSGYELDMQVLTKYIFLPNYEICPWECRYRDLIDISTNFRLPSLAQMSINISEETDTSWLSYDVISSLSSFRLLNTLYASGTNSSFKFKELIRKGGGSFSGTISLTSGSALACNSNVFTTLPPLTVTGTLDTTTKNVTMRIKGKFLY